MCQCFPAFSTQDPAINQLRHKIRYALEEDNPGLVTLWLSMEDSVKSAEISSCWHLYCAQYKLLIDTLSDDLLPKHWRVCCLDNIYRPLSSLQRIAITHDQRQHLNKLYYELRVISLFFQNGLS
ncbi:MAG: hypothetical protein HRU06_07595 [Oceanospirillaceae bacterium]|nr:hypothetical protein [Oceanospirillaceae bacterium]